MATARGRASPVAVGVTLAALLASVLVVFLSSSAAREERERAERRVVSLATQVLQARIEALRRSVRGPVLAFELEGLRPNELQGVLRLAYNQTESLSAVTLLDDQGAAVVPAVFLPRAGPSAGNHPAAALEDLENFSHHLELQSAQSRGWALLGPYPSVHGEGTRVALVEVLAVADGTRQWVLAAEVDAASLVRSVEGLPPGVGLALVSADASVLQVGVEARASSMLRALVGRAQRGAAVPVRGERWRAWVTAAPEGMSGVLALVWSGDAAAEPRVGRAELALGLVVLTVLGALAAVLGVLARARQPEAPRESVAPRAHNEQARLLGLVVKELSNPIAATSGAARLLMGQEHAGRVEEMVLRAALRTERVFRRLVRLWRSGEERAVPQVLELRGVLERESEALRAELEATEITLESTVEGEPRFKGRPEDVALLVGALLDAARMVAPSASRVRVHLSNAGLRVWDQGEPGAGARSAALGKDVAESEEPSGAELAWALAARIAREHGGKLTARAVDEGTELWWQWEGAVAG